MCLFVSFTFWSSAAAAAVATAASPGLVFCFGETTTYVTITRALNKKRQLNGGGPITVGLRYEESNRGAHLGSGIPARASNRAQHRGVRPGDRIVMSFFYERSFDHNHDRDHQIIRQFTKKHASAWCGTGAGSCKCFTRPPHHAAAIWG